MIHIVIPARYGSSRLPGKPLKLIAGTPMIEHVWNQCVKAGYVSVWIATDDQRILDAAEFFGGKVILTRADHPSGTDRLAEVAEINQWDDQDIIVNVQGDEPLVPPDVIQFLANLSETSQAGMATLATPIKATEDLFNTNVVKVVRDNSGNALYFSRASIPWHRDLYASEHLMQETDISELGVLRHLGMYAYRVNTLKQITQLPESPLEKAEALEQLRPMFNGISIQVGVIDEAPAHGVDTPEDLIRVEKIMHQLKQED